MSSKKEGIAVVGAAGAAEVGAHLALDSALVSLAAFGSVVGLGVMHLRARRARARTPAAPSALDPIPQTVIPMPAPAPIPRRDETADAVRELSANLEAFHLAQKSDDARASEETARRVAEVLAACGALEERVLGAEDRLAQQTMRLEKTWAEGTERAGERSKEALGRLCRELTTLHDDVRRTGAAMAELGARTRAPVTLADEQARTLHQAAEQSAAVGRKLSQMSERLDATLARLEGQGADAAGRAEHALRATHERIAELAQAGASLQSFPLEIKKALAATEERMLRRFDSVETAISQIPPPATSQDEEILAALAALHQDVERGLAVVTAPREALDLAPITQAVALAEERITRRVHALDAARPLAATEERLLSELRAIRETLLVPAESVDLAPVLAAIHALDPARRIATGEERILARLDGVDAALSKPFAPLDLSPVLDAVAGAEERVARRVHAIDLARPLAVTEERILARLHDVERAMPASPETLDLQPILSAVASIEERVVRRLQSQDFARPLAASEERVVAELKRLKNALPAPAEAVDVGPILAGLRDVRAALEAGHSAALAAAASTNRECRGIQDAIKALPTPVAPEPFPFDELAAELRALMGSTQRAIHEAGEKTRAQIDALPTPERFPLAKVLDAVDQVRADVAALPRPHAPAPVDLDGVLAEVRDARDASVSAVEDAERRLKDVLAALPRPEAPVAFPIEDIARTIRASEERLAGRIAALPEPPAPVTVSLAPVLDAVEKVRASIASLPAPHAPTPFPVEDIARNIRASEERLAGRIAALPEPPAPASLAPVLDAVEKVRASVAALPRPEAPAPFPVDALVRTIRASEERIAGAIAAIPEPVAPAMPSLAPVLEAVEKVHASVAALPRPEAPPAFPLDDLKGALQGAEERILRKIDRSISALPTPPEPQMVSLAPVLDAVEKVRASVAALPRPEAAVPFPLDDITRAVRGAEERLASRISSLPEAPEAPSLAPVLDAVEKVHAAIAALPRPAPPPSFPLDELARTIRSSEERLAGKIASLPEPPAPQTISLSPVLDAIEDVRAGIAALPRPEAPAPFPLDDIARALRGAEERIVGRIHAIPEPRVPEPVSLAPVLDGISLVARNVRASEEVLLARIASIPEPRMPEPVSLSPVLHAVESVRAAIHALPTPEAPAPFPLEEIARSLRAVEESLLARIAAIPQPVIPAPVSLSPVLSALDAVRSDVAALPRPDVVTRDDLRNTFIPALEGVRDAHGDVTRAIESIHQRVCAAEERVVESLAPLPTLRGDMGALREMMTSIEQARRADHARLLDGLSDVEDAPVALSAQIGALHADVSAQRAALSDELASMCEVLAPLAARAPLDADERRAATAVLGARLDGIAERVAPLEDGMTTLARHASELREAFAAAHAEVTAPLGSILSKVDELGARQRANVADVNAQLRSISEQTAALPSVLDAAAAVLRAPLDALAAKAEEDAGERRSAIAGVHARLATFADHVRPLAEAVQRESAAAPARFQALADAALASEARVQGAVSTVANSVEGVASQVASLQSRLDANAARASDESISLHDAIEDLRADLDTTRQRAESALVQLSRAGDDARAADAARIDALAVRLDKLGRDIEARLATTQGALENAAVQRDASAKVRVSTVAESLVAGQGAFQAAMTDALDASARRMDDRLAAAEARIAALGDVLERAVASRDAETERRWAARFDALEARLLDHRPLTASDAQVFPPLRSSARRHVRPHTE